MDFTSRSGVTEHLLEALIEPDYSTSGHSSAAPYLLRVFKIKKSLQSTSTDRDSNMALAKHFCSSENYFPLTVLVVKKTLPYKRPDFRLQECIGTPKQPKIYKRNGPAGPPPTRARG